jgi:hypothetical protein
MVSVDFAIAAIVVLFSAHYCVSVIEAIDFHRIVTSDHFLRNGTVTSISAQHSELFECLIVQRILTNCKSDIQPQGSN